jgi:hypothetical protein
LAKLGRDIERLLDRAQRWVFMPTLAVCMVLVVLWTIDPIRLWLARHRWVLDENAIVSIALIAVIFVLVSFDQKLTGTQKRLDSFSPFASSRIVRGGVSTIYEPLQAALNEIGPESGEDRTLIVLGLTLYTAWPIVVQPRLGNGGFRDWRVTLYCMNPEFMEANPCFPADWALNARASLSSIQAFARDRSAQMKAYGTSLSVSTYRYFPALHGFSTGAGHLFISYTHWSHSAGRLDEPTQFYEIFQPSDDSQRACMYRELFKNWVTRADADAGSGGVL